MLASSFTPEILHYLVVTETPDFSLIEDKKLKEASSPEASLGGSPKTPISYK